MADYAAALDLNRRTMKGHGSNKISHIEVVHHFEGGNKIPETHTFGKTEGALAIQHISKVLNIKPEDHKPDDTWKEQAGEGGESED